MNTISISPLTNSKRRQRVQFPKRELPPLRRACLSLGLDVNAQPETHLSWLLRRLKLGKTAIDYLRWSDDEQARQIVAKHDSLKTTERKAVTIDYLMMATGADPHHVWGVIQEAYSRVFGLSSELVVATNLVSVTRKLIENAQKDGGHRDRILFFQLADIFPVPESFKIPRFKHRVR